MLPLERETLFNILGDPPYSEADIQAKPMLLMMGKTPDYDTYCKADYGGFRSILDWEDDFYPSLAGRPGVPWHAHSGGDVHRQLHRRDAGGD